MNKLFAILMASAMLVSAAALSGCTGGSDQGSSSDVSSNASSDASSDSSSESAAATKTLTLDNHDGVVMTMEYPESLTYNPDSVALNENFVMKKMTNFGALEGDYTFAFQTEQLYDSYADFPSYMKQFKNNAIYEETKVGDYDAYIKQNADYEIHLYIVYGETEYIEGVLQIENGTADDYKAMYEGEFKTMFDSIKFDGAPQGGSSDTSGTFTTDNGYVTVTAENGWYKGESKQNNALTIYNDKIGPVSWVVIDDSQLSTVDKLKEYVLVGYKDYEFEPITIGSNSYEILTSGSKKDVSFLVAETSSGKGFEIELRNVTVEEATPLLETIVIK